MSHSADNPPYWDLILEVKVSGESLYDWPVNPLMLNGFWKPWEEAKTIEEEDKCHRLFVLLLSKVWPKVYQEILDAIEESPDEIELIYSYNVHNGDGYWRLEEIFGWKKFQSYTTDGFCLLGKTLIRIPADYFVKNPQ